MFCEGKRGGCACSLKAAAVPSCGNSSPAGDESDSLFSDVLLELVAINRLPLTSPRAMQRGNFSPATRQVSRRACILRHYLIYCTPKGSAEGCKARGRWREQEAPDRCRALILLLFPALDPPPVSSTDGPASPVVELLQDAPSFPSRGLLALN